MLITADPTPNLTRELAFFGATLGPSRGEYASIPGLSFPCVAVFLDQVSESEKDELLGAFGHGPLRQPDVRQWWRTHVRDTKEGIMEDASIEELDGYDEVIAKMLATLPNEKIPTALSGLTPQQRLLGLNLEERLQGLPQDKVMAALQEMLRKLQSSK